ncbi:ferritin family protein [Siccirubricoccus sp. G192]|uniref:ferritin-like domain-containing protein n=1 Tax=Siccirubricoccus sp. G192 TaxID=2849651 RepID=UPI001C2C6DAC|nr:ferritin family protein [Siccirubricoccus sp. G192]MBV1795929.1 ferritin family protein [Siccirubricoccus sp. G192]
MRALDLPEVAAVFEHLAAEERGHADQVEGWARSATGAPPDSAWLRWQPPETFDEEAARAMGSSNLASAYRALSMAVRNEERAFALWTYIAAQAEDPAIQAAAERMAGEELRHAALFRRERRRAFHAERQAMMAEERRPRLPPAEEAARAERALAPLLAALAEAEPAADRAAELRRLAMAAAATAAEAPAPDAETGPVPGSEAPADLAGALRLAERAVEAYLDAADAAREEEALRHLQSLAEQAIARIALLRQMAGRG